MLNRTNIQIRVLGAETPDVLKSQNQVEAQIDGSGSWTGQSSFDFAVADPTRLPAEQYGIELGRQLINPAVARAFNFAMPKVDDGNGEVGMRLLLDPSPSITHTIRWERLYFPVGASPWPLAISPKVFFSRYIATEMPDALPLTSPIFRLLIAVANPSNIAEDSAIKVEEELSAFVEEFEKAAVPSRLTVTVLPGRTGISPALAERMKNLRWEIATGNGSLHNIGEVSADCNGIHVLCHGDFRPRSSQGILYLEGADGTLEKVTDDQLITWMNPLLRLAVFQACRTAAPAPIDQPQFVGVAAKLVKLGVPAVIAMQDFVEMADARLFAAAFYRELMQDGLVDKAVNAGRRAIATRSDNWSIPALFLRVKDGQLWSADPVRENVWATRVGICRPPGIPEGLPLTVVQPAHGLDFDPLEEPVGPTFDLELHARALLKESDTYVCLTGPAGSNKSEQLSRLYCLLADEFMADATKPAPLLLSLNDFVRRGPEASRRFDPDNDGMSRFDRVLMSIIDGYDPPDFLRDRRFVALITPGKAMSPAATSAALQTLVSVLKKFQASAIFIFEQTNLDALRLAFPNAIVLVVRPLDMPQVRAILTASGTGTDLNLRHTIDACALDDLAAVPWLLNQMRDLVRFGNQISCRRDVMKLVVDNFLSHFGVLSIPRSSAVTALSQIAWNIKSQRCRSISHIEMWNILQESRGSQDFALSEFRDTLIKSNLLVAVGEDAYSLSYSAVCDYFAAYYLAHSPQSQMYFEEITASLGSTRRVRQWEQTLVFFAALQTTDKEREEILEILLSGSSLAEGEQVFLAARLYLEMFQNSDPHDRALRSTRVVRQMIDTLIWRSRADLPRAYEDRKRAVDSLAKMRDLDDEAIGHLVALACDPVRIPVNLSGSIGNNKTVLPAPVFDFSGIRMLAIDGLFAQYEATARYVKEKRPELLPVLTAWIELITKADRKAIVAILDQNDPSKSTVAALAFAFNGEELEDGHPLLTKFADPNTSSMTARQASSL